MKRIFVTRPTSALVAVILLAGGCGGCGGPVANNTQADNAQPDGSASKTEPHAAVSAIQDDKPKTTAQATTGSPWEALGKHDAVKDKAQASLPEKNDYAGVDRNAPLVAAQAAPGKELKKADVGMGEKGRGYGGGIITTPVKTYWNVKERVALLMVEYNLKMFKANDPDGKGPKTSDEFMKKVIKENDVKLPELPEGCRYLYDPRTEELLVEQPKAP